MAFFDRNPPFSVQTGVLIGRGGRRVQQLFLLMDVDDAGRISYEKVLRLGLSCRLCTVTLFPYRGTDIYAYGHVSAYADA